MGTMVRNPYRHIRAINQTHDNSCWAACMEWWSKAVNNNNSITQSGLRNDANLIALYEHDSETDTVLSPNHQHYGVLEFWELLWFMRQRRWGMQVQQVSGFSRADLQTKLANGPVYIGFYDLSGNTWHVNIICSYDSNLDMVAAMEPRVGKFVDKGFGDFVDFSAFNIVGWK